MATLGGTHLVGVDHVDLVLSGRPRSFVVIHLRNAEVVVSGSDHARQLLHMLEQDSNKKISQVYNSDSA